jgi:hypothetical protein
MPIHSSSERIRRLKADWVTLRVCAARVKLDKSDSTRKSSSHSISMLPPVGLGDGIGVEAMLIPITLYQILIWIK